MHPGLRSALSSLLVSLLTAGCSPGGSTTETASQSGGSSTGAPTSGTPDPTTTTGGASTDSSGSASATGTGTTASTGSTGPVLTTSSETTTPGETTTATTTTGETTGGEAVCGVADADYGECAKVLGVAFDGKECQTLSGCDCGADCGLFFPSLAACAQACAADGQCNPDRIQAVALARDPVQVGTHCDELDACPADEAQKAELLALFPEMLCEPGQFCNGTETCHLKFSGTIDAETWAQLCAASLVPGIEELLCVVFGP